eukprot:gene22359-29456_t
MPRVLLCQVIGKPVVMRRNNEAASDAATYGNVCFADCNGAKNKLGGNCKSLAGCACTQLFAPVCGADGLTYGNVGWGKCAGKEAVYMLESTPCVPGGPLFKCKGEPCAVNSCKADSSALCVSNYCQKFYG